MDWCRQFANDIEGVLEMLPHKEGEVLALRYGLFDGEPQSLTDSARFLKMSAEGVRQSELKAFRRALYAAQAECLNIPAVSQLRQLCVDSSPVVYQTLLASTCCYITLS